MRVRVWKPTLLTIVVVGMALEVGDVGCGVDAEGEPLTLAAPVPAVDSVPAYTMSTALFGVSTWKAFLGPTELVVTGYDVQQSAVHGLQLAWFEETPSAPAHVRVTMLDCSGNAVRLWAGIAAPDGQLTAEETQFVLHAAYDFQEFTARLAETLTPASPEGVGTPTYAFWGVVPSMLNGVNAALGSAAALVAMGGVAPTALAGVTPTAIVMGIADGVATARAGWENPVATPPAGVVSPITLTASGTSCIAAANPSVVDPAVVGAVATQQEIDSIPTDVCESCGDPSEGLVVDPATGDVMASEDGTTLATDPAETEATANPGSAETSAVADPCGTPP